MSSKAVRMTVFMTLETSGCSKSVCFNSSCLARIPAGLPRLTGVLLMMCHVLKSGKYKSCTYGTTNCHLYCSVVFSLTSGHSCLLKSLGAYRLSCRTGLALCLHGQQCFFVCLRGRSFSLSLDISLKKQNGVIDCVNSD